MTQRPYDPDAGLFKTIGAALQKSLVDYVSGGTESLVMNRGTDAAGMPGYGLDQRLRESVNLSDSTIVQGAIGWITTNFPEAPVAVYRHLPDGTRPEQVGHPLTRLIARPNPYYDGEALQAAFAYSYWFNGNAYWRKVRNGLGAVIQLWYEPHWSIRPAWYANPQTDDAFILGYQVYRNGSWSKDLLPVEDVVHFRKGLDPQNPRLGLSPLASAMREVYTDQEAAGYCAAMLANMGIPGLIITPAPGTRINDAQSIKEAFMSRFTGARRGEPLVLSTGVDVKTLSFSPRAMNVADLRHTPESRICALLNIPASVVGFGGGGGRNNIANMHEAREQAIESNIIPTQRAQAGTLTNQLAELLADDEFVGHDLSQVRVLQADRDKLYTRVSMVYTSGIVKRSEARIQIGLQPAADGSDDQYIAKPSAAATSVVPSTEPQPIGDEPQRIQPPMKALAPPEAKDLPPPVGDTTAALQGHVAALLTAIYRAEAS